WLLLAAWRTPGSPKINQCIFAQVIVGRLRIAIGIIGYGGWGFFSYSDLADDRNNFSEVLYVARLLLTLREQCDIGFKFFRRQPIRPFPVKKVTGNNIIRIFLNK